MEFVKLRPGRSTAGKHRVTHVGDQLGEEWLLARAADRVLHDSFVHVLEPGVGPSSTGAGAEHRVLAVRANGGHVTSSQLVRAGNGRHRSGCPSRSRNRPSTQAQPALNPMLARRWRSGASMTSAWRLSRSASCAWA